MATTGVEELVGRERELAAIEQLIAEATERPQLLLLEGEPGIGKTSLWRAGVELARRRGFRVLSARPAEAEAKLSFSALGDLLAGAEDEIGALPGPQRRALRIALLVEDSRGHAPGTRAIAVATLALLDQLARTEPVLVAVDDAQWLDTPSRRVLTFGLRRLDAAPVSFLGTARPGGRLAVETMRCSEVGPVEADAIGRIVSQAMSSRPARPVLRRLARISAGNPFYALEIARALERLPTELDPSAPLPIPQDLRALVRQRLRAVPAQSHKALLAAAALAHPTRAAVDAAVATANALAPAEQAGIVKTERGTIRFTHPLLASVIYSDADRVELHRVHARLAELVTDVEERALHLAASVDAPDTVVATALEKAATAAFDRGAIESAADLIEQALRFTPEAPQETRRIRSVTAAGHLARAGAKTRARELVSAAFSAAPNGRERARAALAASLLGLWPTSLSIERLRDAIRDAAGDERLLADLHGVLAHKLIYAPDLPAASEHARAAVAIAERLDDEARLAVVLVEAAWVELFTGKGLNRPRVERAIALERRAGSPFGSTGAAEGLLASGLGITGELEEAARLLEARIADDRRRGDTGVTWPLQELARIEIQTGRWDRARALAEESLAISSQIEDPPLQWVLASRSLAHLAVLGGDVDKARSLVAEGLRLSAIAESPFTRAELLSTLGLLELALGNPRAALAHLDEVSRFAAAVGVGEPGMLLFVPDRVEALVAVGDLDAADAATTGLEQQIRGLVRPFIKAVAQRCHGLVAAARGDLRAAMTFLADATATTPPNRPFELARTLLAEGTVLRRARRRSAARLALERAAATFAGLGAPIWEANARAELARLGGRPAQSGALTATERQIAELVAAGKTNAEVARTLHVSPKTVEWNLSKVYRKLRVGSRTQLAAKLATRSE